jgi:DNA-binding HxlR family transcriptional regulator
LPEGGDPEVTSARRGDLFDPACPTRRLLDRVGTKWVAMIVKVLAESGELGFAELRRRAPGVSAKMLAQTLRSLTADGLVDRRVEPSVPPRVHYRLTPLGHSLDEPLAALREWAERHMADIDDFARRPSR